MPEANPRVERFGPPSGPAKLIGLVLRRGLKPLSSLGLAFLVFLEEWTPLGKRAQLWHAPVRRALNVAVSRTPAPRGVSWSKLVLSGVPVERSAPNPQSDTAVLYLHGGAFVVCGPGTHRRLAGTLAQDSGATVFSIDYRMPPQIPFTEITGDCLAVYRQLLADGYAPGRIVVAGDSAGGYLTIATAQAIRAAGLPLPAGLVAIAPWLNLRRSLRGERVASEALIPWRQLQLVVQQFVAPLGPEALANPADRDLAGLPPVLVQASSTELLFPDAQHLAAKLAEAGVPTTFEVWEGQIHVFQVAVDINPDARRAVRNAAEFVRRTTGAAVPSAQPETAR
ncbi:MAG: alpha/beta hydrolase [Segniliparus sp.]|uniref:alpha/beta hydrolase n=1 Tax=Segniliparus sp. TaxID=2804064 RepID=UPI003F3F7E19